VGWDDRVIAAAVGVDLAALEGDGGGAVVTGPLSDQQRRVVGIGLQGAQRTAWPAAPTAVGDRQEGLLSGRRRQG
jgi:hypothetical protein